ncbi:MAG: GSU2403 family nucleotidyltransferase fold protein [Deltaproteobacteria bacterium]
MEKIRNLLEFVDIGDSARRQYINALSVFTALEEARKKAAQYRGGMYWKKHSKTKIDYLIRTQTDNSQKSIGPRCSETEGMYEKFTSSKSTIESRIRDLLAEAELHRRLNRAILVGRAPQMLVDILNMFSRAGIAEHFKVIGTHAIYAYETAAGVRIEKEAALETYDIDLLWVVEKKLRFQTLMKFNESSMIALLKKVDSTFVIRDERRYTAVNSKGFEVDIMRREMSNEDTQINSNPSRMTTAEDDFFAVKAPSAGILQGATPFTSVIVSPSGHMARINTVSPVEFIKVKKWLSMRPDRDPIKQSRDKLQANIIEKLVTEYLPHLLIKKTI